LAPHPEITGHTMKNTAIFTEFGVVYHEIIKHPILGLEVGVKLEQDPKKL
jgi:hypothetical protein